MKKIFHSCTTHLKVSYNAFTYLKHKEQKQTDVFLSLYALY